MALSTTLLGKLADSAWTPGLDNIGRLMDGAPCAYLITNLHVLQGGPALKNTKLSYGFYIACAVSQIELAQWVLGLLMQESCPNQAYDCHAHTCARDCCACPEWTWSHAYNYWIESERIKFYVRQCLAQANL